MNETRQRSLLPLVGIFALALLVLGVAQLGSREDEMTHDSAHYLELTRSILRGDGFQTQTEWAHNIPAPGIPRSDTYRAPLYPLLTAAASPLAASLFDAAKWVSVVSGAFVPPLVFLFARRRFGLSLPVSLLAATIAIFHHHLVISGTRALTESPYTAAILAAVFFLTGPRPRPLLGGVLTGVSWLLRYQALLVAPIALLAFIRPGMTRRGFATQAALYAAGFLVVAGPWMVRNVQVAGSPMYTELRYHMVSTYDENVTTYQYFHGLTPAMEPLDYIRAHPGQTIDHLARSGVKIVRTFPQENAGNVGFALAALAGGIVWITRRRHDWRLFASLAYFGVANVGLVAMAFVDHRHLTSLDPIVVLLVAVAIGELWRTRPQTWIRAATIGAVAIGLAWEVRTSWESIAPAKPQYFEFAEATREFLSARLAPGEAVMGEKPYYLSLVLDHPAVSLPWCSDEEFLALAERYDVRFACVGGYNEEHFGDPYPGSFLDTGVLPPWLHPVLEVEDPPVVVYEVTAPGIMAKRENPGGK